MNLFFEDGLLARIDHWRFVNRFPSRTAAIRWLIEWALDQKPKREAEPNRKTKS